MKKALTIALLIAAPLTYADSQPDPSDLTAVNSFAFGTVDDDGNLKGMVGLAGSYSEGNNFLGLVEHGSATRSGFEGKKAQNTRLRYFQVLDTGLDTVSQAGFSIDYMKGWKNYNGVGSDLVALGAIAKVNTPWESVSLFPNIAYVTGKADTGPESVDLKGYQVNLFGSLSIGDWGQYAVFQPQYMHLDGTGKGQLSGADTSFDVFKVKTGYGQPISSDGKWWVEASHTYTRTDAKGTNFNWSEKDKDHKFELGISYYF